MRRKVAAVWVSLFIIISSIVILVEIADRVEAPTTLYVGGINPGNYSKIQWAIDNASDGDTVYVYNGTYYENVVVNKTINLIGQNKNTTIIDGGGVGDVVNITVDFVNITGFTITNSGTGGSYPYYDGGLKLHYVMSCNISGNKLVSNNNGIAVRGSSNIKIYKNNVSNNKWGIFLIYSFGNIINDNIALFNSETGIHLVVSSENYLINNNVSSNRVSGIYLVSSSNNNTIKKCISIENAGISGYGIMVTGSSNNTILQNILNSNEYHGILVRVSSSINTFIINNTISSNIGAGIYLDQSGPKHVIMDNKITENGIDGIIIQQTQNITIRENNILLNGRHGIYIINSNWNIINNNTIFLMDEYGIYILGSSNNKIYHNNIINNTFQAYDDSKDNFWDDVTHPEEITGRIIMEWIIIPHLSKIFLLPMESVILHM